MFYPQSALCFVWISEKKELFPYTVLTVRFLKTRRVRVYCGVPAESLNKIQVKFSHNMTCRTVGRGASSEVQSHMPGGVLSGSQFACESALADKG